MSNADGPSERRTGLSLTYSVAEESGEPLQELEQNLSDLHTLLNFTYWLAGYWSWGYDGEPVRVQRISYGSPFVVEAELLTTLANGAVDAVKLLAAGGTVSTLIVAASKVYMNIGSGYESFANGRKLYADMYDNAAGRKRGREAASQALQLAAENETDPAVAQRLREASRVVLDENWPEHGPRWRAGQLVATLERLSRRRAGTFSVRQNLHD